MALTDIDAQRVRQIMAARRDCPVNRRAIEHAIAAGEKPPAPKPAAAGTVNLHMAELSKILHYAHKRGWIDRVPPIIKQPQPAKRMTWLTPEQAEILLAELPAHLRQMARFALSTGLRETNVRMLTWTQVDMERGTAWIHADQAKAGKNIPVPLNADALDVLREQRGQHRRWVFPVYRRDTKTADAPTGEDLQSRLAQGMHQGGSARATLPRPAPHLGKLAHDGGHAGNGAEGTWGMGQSGDGGALHPPEPRSSGRLGRPGFCLKSGTSARIRSGINAARRW